MSAPTLGMRLTLDDVQRLRPQQVRAHLRRLGADQLALEVDLDSVESDALQRTLLELAPDHDVTLVLRCRGGGHAPDEARRLRALLADLRPQLCAVELRVAEAPVAELVQAVRQQALPVTLGGPCARPERIEELLERQALEGVAALAVETAGDARRMREVLAAHDSERPLWLTPPEVGVNGGSEHRACVQAIVDALGAPVARVYWNGFPAKKSAHAPLIDHVWSTRGVDGLRELAWVTDAQETGADERAVLITGGAGFVGTNLAHRLLEMGRPVIILDNLSRGGTYENVEWLRSVHGDRVRLMLGDVRDETLVRAAVARASAVVHLAAQVAVTTSLEDPRSDFDVNARGALNLLEALRERDERIPLVFTSTNKVYGAMQDVKLRIEGDRHVPEDATVRAHGFDENRPLDFHSPYGCSKGAADQYVLDYARTFGLPNLVFRMSCVYGPHQHGTEDQGWVAHFMLANMHGEPITIYGDGRQVRDVLFVEDVVDAFLRGIDNADELAGRAFNLGGGASNTLSLLELVDRLEGLQGRKPDVRFAPVRPGDQPYYVSDARAFGNATGWEPKVGVQEGLRRLQDWLAAHQGLAKGSDTSPRLSEQPVQPQPRRERAQRQVQG